MTITTLEIAWLAGILEGEAHFGFTNKAGKARTSPRISLQMSDLDIVQRVGRLFGTKVYAKARPATDTKKALHRTYACGKRAIEWMLTIYPLMGERRQEKIRECLEVWKAGVGVSWRKKLTHCKNGHEFTQETTKVRSSDGARRCMVCNRQYLRDRRKRLREAA